MSKKYGWHLGYMRRYGSRLNCFDYFMIAVGVVVVLLFVLLHLLFGHLNYWKSINPTVEEDVAIYSYKIKNRR